MSSSVCRLPFISASASPALTSATASSAAAWLCGASTMRSAGEVLPRGRPRRPRSWPAARRGSARSARARRPRARRRASAASQGCATATFNRRQRFRGREQPVVLLVPAGLDRTRAVMNPKMPRRPPQACRQRCLRSAAPLCERSDAICPAAASPPGPRQRCARSQRPRRRPR